MELYRRGLFQFTPLRKGRRSMCFGMPVKRLFQFTPLRKGRRTRQGCWAWATNFNSRPCVRGDIVPEYDTYVFQFQFTPLRKGRRRRASTATARLLFQFTPLRKGRPK